MLGIPDIYYSTCNREDEMVVRPNESASSRHRMPFGAALRPAVLSDSHAALNLAARLHEPAILTH